MNIYIYKYVCVFILFLYNSHQRGAAPNYSLANSVSLLPRTACIICWFFDLEICHEIYGNLNDYGPELYIILLVK